MSSFSLSVPVNHAISRIFFERLNRILLSYQTSVCEPLCSCNSYRSDYIWYHIFDRILFLWHWITLRIISSLVLCVSLLYLYCFPDLGRMVRSHWDSICHSSDCPPDMGNNRIFEGFMHTRCGRHFHLHHGTNESSDFISRGWNLCDLYLL